MRRSRWSRTLVVLVLVASMVALVGAGPAPGRPTPGGPPEGRPQVTIPEHAAQVAPGVFYLGTAVDKGRVVEGYAFVRYKKGFGKPGTECGNGICEPGENANKCPADCGGEDPEEPDTSSCYGFLARGAKWKTVEPYVVNTENTRGLKKGFVVTNFADDVIKWEAAAGKNILGDGSSTSMKLVADLDSPDDKNEVYFADVGYEGAIAITIVWGVFGGPPPRRYLVEWDQVYDDVDFDWSATGEAGKMDFENIATHELGHSVGLDDLYPEQDPGCSEQTMWGYADYGETNKRDLEAGDITGVSKLYE